MGCIFDLDGVIVDTAKYHFQAWKRLANELGFDFDETQNEQLKGVSRYDSLNLILGWGGVTQTEEQKQQWMVTKNDWYLALINEMNQSEILPGIHSFLEELKVAQIPVALGSASKNSTRILNQIGLASYFKTIVDGNRVVNGKPHPETFLTGAKELNLAPSECIVFEDAPKGVKAAKTGGFMAIGVGSAQHLFEADYIIKGFEKTGLRTIRRLYNNYKTKDEKFSVMANF